MGPVLDALDGTTLAKMSLSTSKTIREERRMPFARSLRHALRLLRQTHNELQVAPANSPNLERATKLIHIDPVFFEVRAHCTNIGCGKREAYINWSMGLLE